MRIKINKIVVWFLIIILTFNASLSYASSYLFTPGTNTITKEDFINNRAFTFKVQETGVYSINLLPKLEDYQWKYNIKGPNGNPLYLAALEQEGLKDANGNNVYKLYSKTTPYFVLFEGTEYTISNQNDDKKAIEVLIKNENYITVSLGTPQSTNSGTYYEAGEIDADLVNEINENNFQYTLAPYDTVTTGEEQQTERVTIIDSTEKEGKTDFVQYLLTLLFVNVIGDNVMWLIGVAAGEPITIDKILFNEYSRTRLGFFTKDVYDEDGQIIQSKVNPFLIQSGILPSGNDEGILNEFFERFTYIAIIAYLIIFLYMGIRIVLSSTGKDTARYKKLFTDWVLGIIILFLFPYVIRYTIKLNDAIVSYIGTLKNKTSSVTIEEPEVVDYPGGLAFPFAYLGSDASTSQDYMSKMRLKALETGKLLYALCWLVMIKELVAFLFIYIKRMLITMFLIVIFPLVTISYAVDKIGDGKSQAFNNWFKEFFLNVFLQTFHAINYVVVMGIIFAVGKSDSEVNFIFVIIGLTYLAQGDKILRGIFSKGMKGGGGDTVKDVATSMMATSGAMNMLKSSVGTIGNGFKKLREIGDNRLNKNNNVSKLQEYKAKQKWDSWNLASGVGQSSNEGANNSSVAENRAAQNVKVALSRGTNPEQLRNALGQLRDYSNAGGDMEALYQKMNLTDEQKKNVDDLMEQNDAVDALQNVETLTEAEINANLHVLITNRKRKGNFAKLDGVLKEKGISQEMQNELFQTVKRRNLSDSAKKKVDRIKRSICTKDDAQRLREIKAIDDEIAKTTNRQERVKSLINTIEIGIKNGGLGDKKAEHENRLRDAKLREAKYAETLSTLKAQKKAIYKNMTDKDAKLPSGSYDKEAKVNSYLEVAKMANGTKSELTNEQKEIAEAQAIVDGSDSGEYTLAEIWEANKKIRKARKTSTDRGINAIIQSSYSNPETKKDSDYFTSKLAAVVVNNQAALSEGTFEEEMIVSEAKEEILDKLEKGGICEHILNESGLKFGKNDQGEETIEKIKNKNIVKDLVKEILADEEKALKEEAEIYGKGITNDDSYQKMKKKVFQERLDLTREISKATVATVTTPAVALTSAAMYAGAASKLKPEELLGVSKLATGVTKEVRDKAIDFAMNKVDSVTNVASGIIDSNKKGELTADKAISTIYYGDDNEKGVETIHNTLNAEKEPDKLSEEEEYRKEVFEKRKVAIERMNKKLERFANGVEASANNTLSNRGRNTTNSNRPLTQADKNKNKNNNKGNR